jgi:hypothetical protein
VIYLSLTEDFCGLVLLHSVALGLSFTLGIDRQEKQ